MNDQFGRKISLIVLNQSNGLELSQFRIRFNVEQSDVQTPNVLSAQIYNLKPETAAKIGKEFNRVILQAGYEDGAFGVIFDGSIKQTRTGKENNVNSYVDILAADGDKVYNQSIISATLAAGATQKDVATAITKSFAEQGLSVSSDASGVIGGVNPNALARGKVMFGMSRDYMRDWSQKNGFRWSIQNGQLVLVPVAGYREGEAVVLNSQTGLIGIPEATEGGVKVRCLLNPKIRIGALLQINSSDITTTNISDPATIHYTPAFAANVTKDGYYRVLVCEYSGDSRGQEWYCDIICIAVDVSASADKSVALQG